MSYVPNDYCMQYLDTSHYYHPYEYYRYHH